MIKKRIMRVEIVPMIPQRPIVKNSTQAFPASSSVISKKI